MLKSKLILIAIFGLLATHSYAEKLRVWIDTDMVIGMPGRDVDDGLALLFALAHDSVEIVGVSVVTYTDHTYDQAKQMLQWYAPDRHVPVYKGADTKAQLGASTEASEALAAALQKEPLTLLVLGPSTNIATAIMQHPEIARNIRLLVMCQGRTPGAHFAPGKEGFRFPDYNFELDPDATQALFNADVPVICAGYQASSNIYLNKHDIKTLFNNKRSPGNKWVYQQTNTWRQMWRRDIKTKKGFIPFDVITVAVVLHPDWYANAKPMKFTIEMAPDDMNDSGTLKPYLLGRPDSSSPDKFIPATDVKYKAEILRMLAKAAGLNAVE